MALKNIAHGVEEVLYDIEKECNVDLNDTKYRHAAMIVKSRADYGRFVMNIPALSSFISFMNLI